MAFGGKGLKGFKVSPESGGESDSGDSTGEGANDGGLLLPDRLPSEAAMPVSAPLNQPESVQPGGDIDLPDKRSELDNVYQQVQKTDPDRAAKILAIQRRIDAPADYIDKNLESIQKATQGPSSSLFKQIENQYPGTAQWLLKPENMAIAHDDIPNTSFTERLINSVKSAWNFESSALQSGALQEDLGFTRYQQLQGQQAGGADMFRVGGSVAARLGITETDPAKRAELISQKLQELDQNRPQEMGVKRGIYGATEFLPQILGGLGYGGKYGVPSAATTAAVTAWAGPIAGLTTPVALAAGMSGGELEYNYKLMTGMAYDQLLKVKDVNGNPLPDSTAKIAATAMGAATAGLSLVKLNTVLDSIPGGKDFLSKFTAQAGEKVLENPASTAQALKTFAQGYVSNVAHGVAAMEGITAVNIAGAEAAKAASGQEFKPTSASHIESQLGQTAEDAAATFGVFGAAGVMPLTRDLVQARKAEQTRDFYTALGNTAEASKVRQRLPEAHQEFISKLTKDSPVENIYIPVEAAQSYFQGKGIDPAAAMEEIGVSKSFEEAKATGGDVKIPLSTWTDKLVGTEHYQGLANDIKFDPDDLTTNEVNARKAEIQDQVQKLINEQKQAQADADLKSGNLEKVRQAGEIASRIRDQLKAAGVSTPETEFSPQVHEAFFNTMGQHLGVDPEELAKRFPLDIRGFDSPEDADAQAIADRQAKGAEEPVQAGESSPDEAVAAQPAYKPEVLQQIRSDVESGKVEKGNLRRDSEGNVIGRHGAVSTYPEYFQKKGFTKKETLRAIDKHLSGDKLTEKQANILHDLYHSSGYDSESQSTKAPVEPFLQAAKYEQGAPKLDSPRGRIRIGQEGYAIDLFRSADRSTFLHETGHYFLDVMGHIASDENAPEQVKKDYQTLLDWMGVKSSDEIGTDEHEKFARGFEQYLMEGKAPSSALQRAFGRFRKWLTSIYKNVKNLNVDMSDDVRGVMDRMLSSEAAIDQAHRDVGLSSEELKGLPPEVQAKINDLQMRARDQAESQLLKEQMAELKTSRKEFLDKERVRIEGNAKDQVAEIPIFKASDEAVETIGEDKRPGTIAEKFLSGRLEPSDMGKFEALAEVHGFKDGEELAQQMIMAEEGNQRQHEIDRRVEAGMAQHADMMNTDAIKAEAMKAIHGHMTTELLALEREALDRLIHNEGVKAEAKRRNMEELEAQRKVEEEEAAKEKDENKRAEMTEKIRQKFEARFERERAHELAPEISRRKRLEAKVEAQAAKEQARQILSSKPIKEAGNAKPYITAERNSAVKAAKALAKGDYEKASEYKRQQMLNHAIAAESMRNRELADKSISYLKDFATRKNDLKDMPYGFMRQIDQMLSRSGFAEPKTEDTATLTSIAKDMDSKGQDPIEIANRTGLAKDENGNWSPESLSDFVSRVNENYYAMSLPDSVLSGASRGSEDLTLGELKELKGAVKAVADIGKKYERFLGEFKTQDIKQAAAEFRKNVEEQYGKPFEEDMLPGSKHATKLGELVSAISKVPGYLDRFLDTMLTTCHKLDGLEEGPAKEYIYRPFEHAESRELARTADTMREVDEIFGKHYGIDEFAKYKDTRINVDGRYFTKEEILTMALNWGNEGNRQRLMDGFGFDEAKMQRIFKNLGKNDWEFCQDVWNHLQKYWPEISQLEMDVNGVEPKGVEPASFSNEHGKFEGGYYPIAYDSDRSVEAARNNQSRDALYKQFSTAAAHTDQGHAQSRARQVNRPISLDLSVLRNHHEDVIHDLEFRRATIDVNRFLNQKDVKVAISNAIGVSGLNAINDWMKAAAGGSSEPMTAFDKAAQWFRFKTTFFNLAYRLVSAPKIGVENLVNISSELGVSGAARAMKDYYFGNTGTHEMVTEKSDFMRARAEHLDRDLADIQKKWQGTNESGFRKFAFFVHAYLDQGVSFPLWSDVYNRRLAEHGDNKLAITQADEAVKRTFMSGGGIDQAAVMRGGEKMKALTTAYGYQSMMWNRFSMQKFQAGQEWIQGNHTAAAAIAARAMVYTFMLPAVTAALTREVLRNSQNTNEDERKKRMATTLLEESNPLKFIPVLRDVSPYLIKTAMGEHATLQATPLEEAAQTLINPIAETLHAFGGHGFSDKFPEKTANAASLLMGVPKEINDVVFNFLDWQQNHGELTLRDAISRRVKK